MHEHFLQFPGNSRLPTQVTSDTQDKDDQFSKKISHWLSNSSREQAITCHDREQSFSAVSPGSGNATHNVTRKQEDAPYTLEKLPDNNFRHLPYSTDSPNEFLSYRYYNLTQNTTLNYTDLRQRNKTPDDSISDMSLSSAGSITPPPTTNSGVLPLTVTPPTGNISSSDKTPSSGAFSPSGSSSASSPVLPRTDRATSKENSENLLKKKARTNFTNEQIKTLMRIFVETPYPDSEMMENIARDLNIKEKQVKIWFQNKRARSRRRTPTSNQHAFLQTTPTPFGYMPAGHMMTSSPLQNFPFNYHMMQGYLGQYNNYQLVGQMIANQNFRNHQITSQSLSPASHATSNLSTLTPPSSSVQYGRTLPQSVLPNQNRQSLQYPSYLFSST